KGVINEVFAGAKLALSSLPEMFALSILMHEDMKIGAFNLSNEEVTLTAGSETASYAMVSRVIMQNNGKVNGRDANHIIAHVRMPDGFWYEADGLRGSLVGIGSETPPLIEPPLMTEFFILARKR
ncbi:MAG: hypothetical protein ACYCPS_06205, partial [Candidatus Saccharimonadales bacterium]